MYYTPLQLVFKRLGIKKTELSKLLNISKDTIFRWQRKKGKIPEQYHDKILELAKTRHKELVKVLSNNVLSKEELFLGGEDE